MNRLCARLMAVLATLALIGCAGPRPLSISSGSALADPIKTEYGLVSGRPVGEDSGVRIYKGIPYAAPPVGNLRWKPPQPRSPWTGVRECTSYSVAAPQGNPFGSSNLTQSEDCLYLNVLTPAKSASDQLPVMVWMHGGGYAFGTGNEPSYNLPALPRHGVVLVTVNMRLNLLGLLAHPLLSKESPNGVSGNYMFLDMVAALKWVRSNIAAFGGDAGNVTIFGESGGAAKVSNLMASPLAAGLFHRAILQSGTATQGFTPGMPMNEAEELGRQVFAALGVDKEADPLAAARSLPWERVIAAQASRPLDAAVDGWFLKDAVPSVFKEGQENPVPFITVANLGEITGPGFPTFLFPTLIPGYTNMLANAGKASVKAYAAIFEHVPAIWSADGAVAPHTMEVPYVFGDMDSSGDLWTLVAALAMAAGAKGNDPGLTDEDRQLSENMMEMWTQFARTGSPSVSGLLEWPAYDAAADKYLVLDVPLKVQSGFSSIAAKRAPTPTATPRLSVPPTPPTQPGGVSVTGSITQSDYADTVVAGPDETVVDATMRHNYRGTIEGTFTIAAHRTVNSRTGQMIAEEEGSFTGKVNGKEGTFTFRSTGGGQWFSLTSGRQWYTYTITAGTGELSGLRGGFDVNITVLNGVATGTYSGTLSFEP